MSSRGKRCWVPAVLTARSPPLDPTVASSSQARLMRPQLLSDGTYVLSLCLNYTRLCPVCQPFWMVGSASISKGREKGGIDAAIPFDGIWLRLQDTDRSAGTSVNVPPDRVRGFYAVARVGRAPTASCWYPGQAHSHTRTYAIVLPALS